MNFSFIERLTNQKSLDGKSTVHGITDQDTNSEAMPPSLRTRRRVLSDPPVRPSAVSRDRESRKAGLRKQVRDRVQELGGGSVTRPWCSREDEDLMFSVLNTFTPDEAAGINGGLLYAGAMSGSEDAARLFMEHVHFSSLYPVKASQHQMRRVGARFPHLKHPGSDFPRHVVSNLMTRGEPWTECEEDLKMGQMLKNASRATRAEILKCIVETIARNKTVKHEETAKRLNMMIESFEALERDTDTDSDGDGDSDSDEYTGLSRPP